MAYILSVLYNMFDNFNRKKEVEKVIPLDEKTEPISCNFCEKEAPSEKSLKEFQEKLIAADKTDIKEYDGVWRLGDMGFDTGDEYVAVNKRFYVCEKCMFEITCSQCNKLLTRQQIFNLINSEGEWNSLNEGLCVGGPVACTECWIKGDSQMQWDMGIKVCDSCNNFDDECECSSDEEE